MERDLITRLHRHFESSVHLKQGAEYWYARDLQKLLGYDRWENFSKVLVKAKVACEGAKQKADDHFRDVTKMVDIGLGSQRSVSDILLSRLHQLRFKW